MDRLNPVSEGPPTHRPLSIFEPIVQVTGAALAIWIQQSRDTALPTARQIDPQIRQYFTGFYDEGVLNRTRYKIGDDGFFNLASKTLYFNEDVLAIVLVDIVFFRNQIDAQNNLGLWAHELYHVLQYRDWGVHDFALRYVRDRGSSIERDAEDARNRYAVWYASGATFPREPIPEPPQTLAPLPDIPTRGPWPV